MSYSFDSLTTGTGILFDSTGVIASGGELIQITADSATSGDLVSLSADALTSGRGLYISSTSTALSSGNAISVDWSPAGSTEIFSTGDLFKINAGQYANPLNLLALYDNGSELFSVDQTKITSAVPHEFTAAGDVSIAYDLLMANQSVSYIKSNAPLYIQAGEASENNDLTLDTYGAGDIVLTPGSSTTGNVLIGDADPTIIFDVTTATDTDFWIGVQDDAGSDDDDVFQIGDGTTPGTNPFLTLTTTGNLGIGDTGPDAKLEILSSTEQLRLSHTDGTDVTFTVAATGALTLSSSTGGIASITLDTDGTGDAELVLPANSVVMSEINDLCT